MTVTWCRPLTSHSLSSAGVRPLCDYRRTAYCHAYLAYLCAVVVRHFVFMCLVVFSKPFTFRKELSTSKTRFYFAIFSPSQGSSYLHTHHISICHHFSHAKRTSFDISCSVGWQWAFFQLSYIWQSVCFTFVKWKTFSESSKWAGSFLLLFRRRRCAFFSHLCYFRWEICYYPYLCSCLCNLSFFEAFKMISSPMLVCEVSWGNLEQA